jgi:hypothetical protein
MAAVAALMFAAGMVTMNRQGMGGALLVLSGMFVSIVAFAMAVVAKLVLRERWAWLWFPLLLVPAFTLVFTLVPFVLFADY